MVQKSASGHLVRLRRLVIHENSLASLPETFGALAALEHLDAGHNQLERLPGSIGDCRALSWLVLSGNRLASLPAGFGRLHALRRAFLTGNRLSDLPRPEPETAALLEISDNAFGPAFFATYKTPAAPLWRVCWTDKTGATTHLPAPG